MEDFNSASTNLFLLKLIESKVDPATKVTTKVRLYRNNMDFLEFGIKVDMLAIITYLKRERKIIISPC